METENTINFLDVSVSYDNKGSIFTNWYSKPLASHRYTSYYSNAPLSYKKNVIKNLTDRAVKLSHPKFRKENLNKIRKILLENNYPLTFINKHIKKRVHAIFNSSQQINQQDIYMTLPYVHGLSEKINKCVKKQKFSVSHKLKNTNQQFFSKMKPKISINKQTHTVYQIPCNDCNCTYVGQSKQYL